MSWRSKKRTLRAARAAALYLGAVTAFGGAGAALAVAATAETADTGALETIIVTSEKRGEENIQSVPIAITAVTAQAIEDAHTANLEALTGAVPNVQIGHFSNTPTGAVFNIRGMGVIEPDPYAGQTVTVVVDGVPQFYNMTSLPDLFDIERIEILKGPQGTLFGANTTGGVVNIITEQPTGEYGGKASASIGNFRRLDADASFNFPILANELAGKVSILHHGQYGYVTNVVDGTSMGDQNDTDLRAYLKWTPTDKFTATLIQEYDQIHDGGPVVVQGGVPGEAEYVAPGTRLPGDSRGQYPSPCLPVGQPCHAPSGTYYSANSGVPDKEYQDIYATTLTMNWNSPVGDLTSITGYKRFTDDNFTDQDGTILFLDATHRITSGYQFTQELRDSLRPTSGMQLLFGTFLAYDHYSHEQNFLIQFAAPGFRQDSFQNQTRRSESVFVQSYFDLTDKLRFQAGVRGTNEHTAGVATVNNSINLVGSPPQAVFTGDTALGGYAYSGARSWNNIGGKTGLDYKFTDTVMTYIYYARGFKSGGYVLRAPINPIDIGPYGPEKVDTIELGLKADWFDHRLRTNAAIFYNKYHDLQLSEIFFTKDANGNAVNSNRIVNAAQAKTQGIELDVNAAPVEHLKINASIAYLYAKYTTFLYNDPNLGGKTVDLSGTDLQNSPHVTASAGFSYSVPMGPGKTALGLRDRYTGKRFEENLDNTPRATIQSTNYIDGTLDWAPTDGKWSAGVWVRNIADKHYIASVYDAPGTLGLVNYEPPREFGATFHYNW